MRHTAILTVLLASLTASAAVAADPATLAYGKRLADQACGACHATADGPSPLADAPPFRALHRRYPPGGLAQLLEEGMLPPATMQEEGSRPSHPRMPMATLDPDEVSALTAYLRSLEPAR